MINATKLTPALMKALAEHHEQEARAIRKRLADVRCRTCDHWGGTRGCEKFGVMPPEGVQSKGCDEYEFDPIPF